LEEANPVQAADSLRFLNCNVDLFLKFARNGKWAVAEVRHKFNYSYGRIEVPHARDLALPMLQQANARPALLKGEIPQNGSLKQ